MGVFDLGYQGGKLVFRSFNIGYLPPELLKPEHLARVFGIMGEVEIVKKNNYLIQMEHINMNPPNMDRIPRMPEINLRRIVSKIIIILAVFIIIFGAFGTIGAGERGILLQFGAVQDKIFGEGLYVKIPIIQKVVIIDVKIKKDEVPVSAASKDLQIVTSKIALNYHLAPESVNKIWQEVGKDYNVKVVAPTIQEVVKAITAKFTAEELITKREEVKEQIKSTLAERLAERFIVVDEFNIIDFEFSSAFNDAIEAKVTAEQLKLKADRDLERIKIEAEQEIAEAQGKAEAIRIEAKALIENPKVVELRWIEKWDGKVPTYWGGASPFIGINK